MRPIGNTVYLMPPYAIGDEEIDLLVDGTLATLNAVAFTDSPQKGARDVALA